MTPMIWLAPFASIRAPMFGMYWYCSIFSRISCAVSGDIFSRCPWITLDTVAVDTFNARAISLMVIPSAPCFLFHTWHCLIQIRIPSQWSISCWMICAVKPSNAPVRARNSRS